MYLYELALELGERSTELADRARQHGIDGASPSTDLTPAQVSVLRRNSPTAAPMVGSVAPPLGESGHVEATPGSSLPTPPGIAAYQQRASAPRTGLSGSHYAIFGVLGLGVLAVLGFLFIGTAEESYRPLGDGTTTNNGRDMIPVDTERFCAAASRIERNSVGSTEDMMPEEIRDAVFAFFDEQEAAMDEIVASGPTAMREDLEFVQNELSHMLDDLDRDASAAELTAFDVADPSARFENADARIKRVARDNCASQ